MKLTMKLGALIVITAMASACGRDDEPATEVPAAAAPAANASTPVGFIEIDGRKWTVIADVRCSVMPGPVVSIAGHAAEDKDTRIVVDFKLPDGPTGVSVVPSNGSTEWNAEYAMNFEITRKQVRGAGYFAGTRAGSTRQAQGRFEITCP